jgi:hypothetical protein
MFYILDENKQIQPEPDMAKWVAWYNNISNRQVARDTVGDLLVSTVFLAQGPDPKALFETVVLGGDKTEDRRYNIWAAAEVGHIEIVERLRKEMEDDGD